MPTKPRHYRAPAPVPKGQARCDLCATPFEIRSTGQPHRFCSYACLQCSCTLERIEILIEHIPDALPSEGVSHIRRRLWQVANRLNVKQAKPTPVKQAKPTP